MSFLNTEFALSFKLKKESCSDLSIGTLMSIYYILVKLDLVSELKVTNRVQLKRVVLTACIENKHNLTLYREIKKLLNK